MADIKNRIAIAIAVIGAIATITAAVVSHLGSSSKSGEPPVSINVDIVKAIEMARIEATKIAKPVKPDTELKHLSSVDRAFLVAAADGVRQVAEKVEKGSFYSKPTMRKEDSFIIHQVSHSFGSVQVNSFTKIVDFAFGKDVIELMYLDLLANEIVSIRIEDFTLTHTHGEVSLSAFEDSLKRNGFTIEDFMSRSGINTIAKVTSFTLTMTWRSPEGDLIKVTSISPLIENSDG